MASPVKQFEISEIIRFGVIGDSPVALTNSGLHMILIVAFITGGLMLATRGTLLVPNRWQSLAETIYEFVANMLREMTGKEGMRFFPFVFSLFLFVLVANLVGMIPGAFTVTSHIIITFALAILVIGTVIVYGFFKHGFHFLGLFVPSGVPVWLAPFITVIEIISFFSRPISLSLRLFANIPGGQYRRSSVSPCFIGPRVGGNGTSVSLFSEDIRLIASRSQCRPKPTLHCSPASTSNDARASRH